MYTYIIFIYIYTDIHISKCPRAQCLGHRAPLLLPKRSTKASLAKRWSLVLQTWRPAVYDKISLHDII